MGGGGREGEGLGGGQGRVVRGRERCGRREAGVAKIESDLTPSLVIVTGPLGAGKTRLAHILARAVRCPLVSRDEIKEGLVNASGGESDGLAGKAYETFSDALRLLLGHGVTTVAEAAFQHAKWGPIVEPLAEIARLRVIVCIVDPDSARARRIERVAHDPDRARFHPDDMSLGTYDPPRFETLILTVLTRDGYEPNFARIVAFARG